MKAHKIFKSKPIIILSVAVLAVLCTIVVILYLQPKYAVTINDVKQVRNNVEIGGAKVLSTKNENGIKVVSAEMATDCNLIKEEDAIRCDMLQVSGTYSGDDKLAADVSGSATNVKVNQGIISFDSVEKIIKPMSITNIEEKKSEKDKYSIELKDNNKTVLVYNLTIVTNFTKADNELLSKNAIPLEFSGNGTFVTAPFNLKPGLYVVKYDVNDSSEWGGGSIKFNKTDGEYHGVQDIYLQNSHTSGTSSISVSKQAAGEYRMTIDGGGYTDSNVQDWKVTITK
ncbi:hypothetical protein EOL73_03250 [Candidatus Saccharibacteria bacterium]|nr:hypothetical protein [Candidatus Saccharibacteria bacterium]